MGNTVDVINRRRDVESLVRGQISVLWESWYYVTRFQQQEKSPARNALGLSPEPSSVFLHILHQASRHFLQLAHHVEAGNTGLSTSVSIWLPAAENEADTEFSLIPKGCLRKSNRSCGGTQRVHMRTLCKRSAGIGTILKCSGNRY
jgi:hypothetical protein